MSIRQAIADAEYRPHLGKANACQVVRLEREMRDRPYTLTESLDARDIAAGLIVCTGLIVLLTMTVIAFG